MTTTIDLTLADLCRDYRLDCHCNSDGGVEDIDIMSGVIWHGDYGLALNVDEESILMLDGAARWLLSKFGDEIQELCNEARQRQREDRAAEISERLNTQYGWGVR